MSCVVLIIVRTMVKVLVNATDSKDTVFILPTPVTEFHVVHTAWSLHKCCVYQHCEKESCRFSDKPEVQCINYSIYKQ